MDGHGETPANPLELWADSVVARLDVQEDVDRSLLHALEKGPNLREETASRMADALRAAALGLSPAGCAMAAGVSERLLRNWQTQNELFATAMTAAAEMARTQTAGPTRQLNPAALRVLLKALRSGAQHGPAAALVGMSGRALYRLRKESPEVAALVAAARRARPRKSDLRRRSRYEQRYRLVRLEGKVERSTVCEPRCSGPHRAHTGYLHRAEPEPPPGDGEGCACRRD
ncbi:hypothetical protein ABZ348_33860 [Streptomyces sp. NPDC005963]|uniref:hypothetical protein n=1 Tax=Streptomyces sp. NPDC005963 TaxID=3156721 RepID=UPI0034115F17